ncbi:MAG: hypothetical protein GEV08_18480, partial [Acidimicrobiia bacterium]|nr:hypothetical protein [Acidimicrobiia bacterium]
MQFEPGGGPTSHHPPPPGQELRLALAMRGGVSLAVWIGGAVSEIDALRQRQGVYGRLMSLLGYEKAVVDVLSGASAGGLNAAVYSAAQVYDFDVGELRDLWCSIADIEALARSTTTGGRAQESYLEEATARRAEALRPPSLLRGDGYLYAQLVDRLASLIAERRPATGTAPYGQGRPATGTASYAQRAPGGDTVERLELILSATLYEPTVVRVRANRSATVEDRRSGATFRFRHRPGQGDFPASPDAQDPAVGRLAMAARATSSFPGAFEPARIAVGRQAAERVVDHLDFAGRFHAPAPAAHHVHQVIDGGVLDNIPVAAALSAVADAPADGPTERWLVFLHPSPGPTRAEEEARPAGVAGSPRAVASALRSLAARVGQESLLDDIAELARLNDVVRRRQLALQAIFAELAARAAATAPAAAGRTGRSRAAAGALGRARATELDDIRRQIEADRVLGSLRRPDSIPSAPPDLPAQPLGDWSADDELALGAALQAAVGPGAPLAIHDTTAALVDAADLVIAWARHRQGLPGGATPQVAAVKRTGYRVRAVARAVEAVQDAWWVRRAAARPGAAAGGTLEAWAVAGWRARPAFVPAAGAAAIEAALDDDEALGQLGQRLGALLDGPGPHATVAVGDVLWPRLVSLGAQL